MPKHLLESTKETRRRLGDIGKNKFYNLVKAKELETVKLGSRRMVIAASTDALIERLISEAA
jgi:hypothetical protein